MRTLQILAAAVLLPVVDYSSAAEITITSLPYEITTPGNYTVATDLSGIGGGITVAANNIVLDLGGHPLSISGNGYGIFAFLRSNVTVKNGIVNSTNSNVGEAIVFFESNHCVFDHLSVIASNLAFRDEKGYDNWIRHCELTSSKGTPVADPSGPSGITNVATLVLLGCRDDLVEDNLISTAFSVNNNAGFFVAASTLGQEADLFGNTFRGNVIRTPNNLPLGMKLAPFDVYQGNLFPGWPKGTNLVQGGVNVTD